MLLVAVGVDIERGEERLARVLHAGEEVDDVLLLLHHPFLLLLPVGDALGTEDALPVVVGDLDVVLDGRRVLQFRFLRHADECLDVVPLALEERCIVRYRVIGVVSGRHPTDDGELRLLAVLLHPLLQVRPRTMHIEERYRLVVVCWRGVPPVGIIDIRYMTILVCRREAAVTRLLADEPDDALAVGGEDDDRYGEAEVLEVLRHPEEVARDVVVQEEVVDLVLHLPAGISGVVDQSVAIAELGVEELAGGECLVSLNEVQDVVRHLVVAPQGMIEWWSSSCIGDISFSSRKTDDESTQKAARASKPGMGSTELIFRL